MWKFEEVSHETLYTLHSTPYALHFTLHTLNFRLYTLHFKLCTPQSTLYTLHFALHTLHCALHTLHFTLCTSHFTLYPYFTLYTLHPILLHFSLFTPHFTLYTPHSTLYTLDFILCTLHFTLYTPQSPLYTLHATFPTQHSTFFMLHTFHSTPFHISQSTVLWYGNRGKMYKTVQKTCFTQVFYVTAFGFVGCILFLKVLPGLNFAFCGIRGISLDGEDFESATTCATRTATLDSMHCGHWSREKDDNKGCLKKKTSDHWQR